MPKWIPGMSAQIKNQCENFQMYGVVFKIYAFLFRCDGPASEINTTNKFQVTFATCFCSVYFLVVCIFPVF